MDEFLLVVFRIAFSYLAILSTRSLHKETQRKMHGLTTTFKRKYEEALVALELLIYSGWLAILLHGLSLFVPPV